jgi:hypothetical protein
MEFEALLTARFLKEAIQRAIAGGIPAAYFGYLLVLPLLTSLIAAARHLLGLTTYGTFIPAIISVIWIEVGFWVGLLASAVLFLWARLVRLITKKTMIRKFRINYLPRMAIFLLLLAFGLLAAGLIPGLVWVFKGKEKVFPFLALVLILQSLIETQMTLSKKEAKDMILETIIFASLGYLLFSWSALQKLVLNYPGLTIILILAFNIYIGRYVGFRLFEFRRFKSIVKKSSG